VALTATERWLQKLGAALATPHSRFERLTKLKPPALPGDTYIYVALRTLASKHMIKMYG
jgi:hypothetical protein